MSDTGSGEGAANDATVQVSEYQASEDRERRRRKLDAAVEHSSSQHALAEEALEAARADVQRVTDLAEAKVTKAAELVDRRASELVEAREALAAFQEANDGLV